MDPKYAYGMMNKSAIGQGLNNSFGACKIYLIIQRMINKWELPQMHFKNIKELQKDTHKLQKVWLE